MITVDDFRLFCGRTIAGTLVAVDRLGDELVNLRPSHRSANTPFQLVTHAFSAAEWWFAHVILGQPSNRVRDDEFHACGSVAELHAAAQRLLDLLDELAPELTAATATVHQPATETPLGQDWTVGAALIHAYEELAQHLGHLEVTVDVLLADF
ncbi:MAG: DinB family protein [Acidimicrobiales bacterium]|nr:DinB family protein [Acidimicrobiales bacterium]MDG1876417.1 DinB family protein [Acidimicrobiales bacterium]